MIDVHLAVISSSRNSCGYNSYISGQFSIKLVFFPSSDVQIIIVIMVTMGQSFEVSLEIDTSVSFLTDFEDTHIF